MKRETIAINYESSKIEDFWKNDIGIKGMMVLPHLVAISSVCHMKKGDIVIEKGEKIDVVPFVLSGIYEAFDIDKKGKKRVDSFGWRIGSPITTITKMERDIVSEMSIMCLKEGYMLYVPLDQLMQLMGTYEELRAVYANTLAQTFEAYVEKCHMLIGHTATEKLEWFYESHADIVNQISQKDMASFLGIHEKSLSRLMNE